MGEKYRGRTEGKERGEGARERSEGKERGEGPKGYRKGRHVNKNKRNGKEECISMKAVSGWGKAVRKWEGGEKRGQRGIRISRMGKGGGKEERG